jgi:putative phosphoesterase
MGVARVICAGDLVGYGPRPDAVVRFLRERQIASARGNHDRWALERRPGVADDFGGGTPSLQTLEYLASLPPSLVFEAGKWIGVVVHGSPSSDMEFVSRGSHPPSLLARYLDDLTCDMLVVGHTHQPMWYRNSRGGLVVNPGSLVSSAKIDSSRTFAVVDLGRLEVTFHELDTGGTLPLDPWS